MSDSHERSLKALERRGRLRSLTPRQGADFSSNDYLGLSGSPELKAAAEDALARGIEVGAGGSRLLRGNHPEIEALEDEAAAHFGAECALYFSGGFQANYALFATLPQREDLVVHDALIHASVHDGMRAGRARTVPSRHNDAQAFEDAIVDWRAAGGLGRPWIAVETLYSMDGDIAPLDDLIRIADKHDANLVLDEAHATGIYGPNGRGLGAALEGRENVISLHTCGKALGVSGGLLLLPKLMRDFLVNRCRPFIFATAPSPLIAAVVRRALSLIADNSGRRDALLQRVADFDDLARHMSLPVTLSGTHIQPFIVGADAAAVSLAAHMQEQGFDVRAVRPPTVPENTARLRIALTLNASWPETEAMVAALAKQSSLFGLNDHLSDAVCASR